MDISSILAAVSTPIMVVVSIVVLGLLISLGNERQRRAIDGIRKEVENWSVNDLRLKRGELAHAKDIPDPILWLSLATSKALGTPVNLTNQQIHEGPKVVAFENSESGSRLFYSLIEPGEMKKMAKRKPTKADQLNLNSHPFKKWNRNITTVQLNILNAGIVFDLELPNAWKELANEATDAEVLWLYMS